jgi:alanine racemase
VIKSNAYGHGMVEVAQALAETDAFAVARVQEGVALRQAGFKHPILLLEGVHTAEQLQLASECQLSPVFNNHSQLNLLEQLSLSSPLSFCWVMVETGMNRLGFTESEIEAVVALLNKNENINGQIGLMSHFANSDLVGDERNQTQLAKLKYCAEQLNLSISMANSAAVLSYPDSHGDWVRPGIMLYGSSPFDTQTSSALNLKPVMCLKSVITAIKNVEKGDQVGYGGDWIADKTTQIGIVSIGYGDGYSRHLSNQGQVQVADKVVDVIGRVSMDMIVIDLSSCQNVAVGDEVILWGCEQLTIDDIASRAHTISYELLCQLTARVPRVYLNG